MRPVEPHRAAGLEARARVFVKDQPEYDDLPALIEPNGTVHTRWALTPAERKAIAEGAFVTLELTFNTPLQPIRLGVEGVHDPSV